MSYKTDFETKAGLGCLLMIIIMIAAWFTHIIVCIKDESWILLLAGAIAFPISIVHGIGSWFGLF